MLRLLPAPALGRPAPAHHDRDGADARAGAADRRRADHRARRHHAGADPEADRASCSASTAPACCSSPTTSASSPRSPTAWPCCELGELVEMGPTERGAAAPAACLHPDADRLGAVTHAAAAQRPATTGARWCCSREALAKTYGDSGWFGKARTVQAAQRRRPRDPPRRDAGHRRRIGLGQVDRGALHRAADRPDRRPASCSAAPTSPRCRRGQLRAAAPQACRSSSRIPYRSLNPRRTVGESIVEGPMNFGLGAPRRWRARAS